MHIVIDDNQRCRLIDPLDDGDQPLGLHVGEACRRFVEQNQPWFVGEHGADFHELALPVSQFAY